MGIFDKIKALGEQFEAYPKVVTKYYDTGEKESEGMVKKLSKETDVFGNRIEIRTGPWTFWYKNGQKHHEYILNDIDGKFPVTDNYDGPATYWNKNGQKIKEGTWKDGYLDGHWIHYYDNGQKEREGDHKDGIVDGGDDYMGDGKEGKWIYWDENGNETKWEIYNDGALVDAWWHSIINLLKEKGEKTTTSDIDAHLKHKNVNEIKEICEMMYHGGSINRTSNYRYFVLTDEKKKPKKDVATKSETVDVEKELEKLKGLLDKGLITQEDYDAKKKELLGL